MLLVVLVFILHVIVDASCSSLLLLVGSSCYSLACFGLKHLGHGHRHRPTPSTCSASAHGICARHRRTVAARPPPFHCSGSAHGIASAHGLLAMAKGLPVKLARMLNIMQLEVYIQRCAYPRTTAAMTALDAALAAEFPRRTQCSSLAHLEACCLCINSKLGV